MKLRCILMAAIAAILLSCRPALALQTEPDIGESKAAIVMDSSGSVLWSMNPDEEMGMASITKVMTAVVALDSGMDLDEVCAIEMVDLGPYSQTAGFTSSDEPTLRDLLRVMLVYSGNDAACYVAQNVAGSEEAFVNLMNEKASELGLAHTRFANPHGLEQEGHYSTVSDLAALGRYALENYPFIASTVRLPSVEAYADGWLQTFESTDYLVGSYEGALGIKTGSELSGYCFLGAARRNGATLYSCVLGCDSDWGRWADTMELLNWGYSAMSSRKVASDGWVIATMPFAYDFRFNCPVTPSATRSIGYYSTGIPLTYESSMMRSSLLAVPGQAVGSIRWRQGGSVVGSVLVQTDGTLGRIPAFNIFSAPLFIEE